eukprot:scaffold201556_cov28-Tisochrysis_lutea.AAC.3
MPRAVAIVVAGVAMAAVVVAMAAVVAAKRAKVEVVRAAGTVAMGSRPLWARLSVAAPPIDRPQEPTESPPKGAAGSPRGRRQAARFVTGRVPAHCPLSVPCRP